MKKFKLSAIIAAIAVSATMLVGCGSGEGITGEKSVVSIGLTTSEGGMNDKSFNQITNDGIKKAESEFGINYTVLESQKKEDYEPNLQGLVDNGSDMIFATGYQLADAVKKTATNNPNNKFCIIDTVVEADNVLSVMFKEEEGSFLMGVIAGLTTKTNKVGFIGGTDQESIIKFESGFAAGVATVNPEAAKGLISSDGNSTGSTVKYANSFSDTNKGYELAKSLYESGCDVIYHASGAVGVGMLQAAKELRANGEEVWGIGVDIDQAVSLPEYKDVILSSMMKKIDKVSYDVVKSTMDGNFKGGSVVLGIAEDGVGISDTTSNNTSEEVITKVKDYEEIVKNGEIVVPKTRQGVIDFTK